MRTKLPYVAAAAALTGFLLFAGVSLASAQTTPGTTPSQSQPSDQGGAVAPGNGSSQAQNGDDPNCPNMGGSSGTSGQASQTGFGPHNRHASSGNSSSVL